MSAARFAQAALADSSGDLVATVMAEPGMARPRYLVRFGPFASQRQVESARAAILDFVPEAAVIDLEA